MATRSPHGDGANVRPSDRRGIGKPTEPTATTAASTLVVESLESAITTTQHSDKAHTNSDVVTPSLSDHVTNEPKSSPTEAAVRTSVTATVGGT